MSYCDIAWSKEPSSPMHNVSAALPFSTLASWQCPWYLWMYFWRKIWVIEVVVWCLHCESIKPFSCKFWFPRWVSCVEFVSVLIEMGFLKNSQSWFPFLFALNCFVLLLSMSLLLRGGLCWRYGTMALFVWKVCRCQKKDLGSLCAYMFFSVQIVLLMLCFDREVANVFVWDLV